MIEISLCMIVKNEEEVLGRCLESIKDIVDEIIIVDTGSNDRTKEIAEIYTPHVYHFSWIDDFSAARNYSFSKATREFVMWLDADDVILEKDKEQLLCLKETLDTDVDLVMMKYNVSFDQSGLPIVSYFRERLMKRSKDYQWLGPIHEVITPVGNVIYMDNIAISHKKIKQNEPQRNLKIFRKMISSGIPMDARQRFYYARELYYNQMYEAAIEVFLDFLNGSEGWVENKIDACKNLAECYFHRGMQSEGAKALLQSLLYDTPRAEICCELGKYFLGINQINTAVFWYEYALSLSPGKSTGGFQQLDCYGYIPSIQLCVCWYRLGDHDKASAFNEAAARLKPDDSAVEYNRTYFKGLKQVGIAKNI